MNQKKNIHPVIFAGAGPGDPELITVRAVRHLREAEVVITDRLVSEAILENYVHPDALVLHAGKQRKREASTPQHIINELLVEYALQGKRVLRLKGGDVSVFSNLLDELRALIRYGIPYEIVPGITAACGAAAYAGIPLTARNHSQAVRLLTLHQADLISGTYWVELAHTEDSLVFYMSGDNAGELVNRLNSAGIRADMPLAIIEQATTPMQKVYSSTMERFSNELGGQHFLSPTLIVVGQVVSLHNELRWLEENFSGEELYFKPVTKKKSEEARA